MVVGRRSLLLMGRSDTHSRVLVLGCIPTGRRSAVLHYCSVLHRLHYAECGRRPQVSSAGDTVTVRDYIYVYKALKFEDWKRFKMTIFLLSRYKMTYTET